MNAKEPKNRIQNTTAVIDCRCFQSLHRAGISLCEKASQHGWQSKLGQRVHYSVEQVRILKVGLIARLLLRNRL